MKRNIGHGKWLVLFRILSNIFYLCIILQQGFPGGSIKAMQKQEIPEDELMSDEDEQEIRDDENQELDPRAGHVDVLLPQLKFSPKQIVHLLEQYRFHPGSSTKSRKAVAKLISEYVYLKQI